jgi:hypothetical protein
MHKWRNHTIPQYRRFERQLTAPPQKPQQASAYRYNYQPEKQTIVKLYRNTRYQPRNGTRS